MIYIIHWMKIWLESMKNVLQPGNLYLKAISFSDAKLIPRLPRFLKSNIKGITLKLKKESLIFLPDKILIIKNNKIGAINYENLNYDIYAFGFIEAKKPPKDAEFAQNAGSAQIRMVPRIKGIRITDSFQYTSMEELILLRLKV